MFCSLALKVRLTIGEQQLQPLSFVGTADTVEFVGGQSIGAPVVKHAAVGLKFDTEAGVRVLTVTPPIRLQSFVDYEMQVQLLCQGLAQPVQLGIISRAAPMPLPLSADENVVVGFCLSSIMAVLESECRSADEFWVKHCPARAPTRSLHRQLDR